MKNIEKYRKKVNETSNIPNIMSFIIPEKKNWIKNNNLYSIKHMDNIYTIHKGSEKWFEDNIGKRVVFKYYSNANPKFILNYHIHI